MGSRWYFFSDVLLTGIQRGLSATTKNKDINETIMKMPTGGYMRTSMGWSLNIPMDFMPGISFRGGTASGPEPMRNCSCKTFE